MVVKTLLALYTANEGPAQEACNGKLSNMNGQI